MTHFRIIRFVLAIVFLSAIPSTGPAQEGPAPQAKVQQLIDLLNDPEVREALAARAPEVVAPPAFSLTASVTGLDAALHNRFLVLRQAVARFPGELDVAAGIVARDINAGRPGIVIAILAALVLMGLFAEKLVRRALSGSNRRNERSGTLASSLTIPGEILPLVAFIAVTVGTFVSFGWPPLLRRVVLTYLFALIAFRVVMAPARLLTAFHRVGDSSPPEDSAAIVGDEHRSRFWYGRTRVFLATFLFAWATVSLLPELGFSADVVQLSALVCGLGLLAIAVAAVWQRPRIGDRRVLAKDVLLSLYLGLFWLCWVAGFYGLLWVGIFTILLPPILSVTGRAAASFGKARNAQGIMGAVTNVLVVRGVRAVVIALPVGWLAYVWRFSVAAQAGGARMEALVEGLLQGLVILLIADVLWQICKAVIERQVQSSDATSAAEAARNSRLRTLLPLFRNTLAVFIAVVTALTVLSVLGVAIGPLIAGAGIFGVAIGFGSQTLVKDILSGVFFMVDDAFRVGEYIQSGSYKGTVESFSLRSVRLRHHRGPVFTVPFGDLGAVQNMSRDWVIDTMTINVTYDTDIDLARRLIKKVGQQLAADPEFAANTIEPLKMQGVESFGDYAIVLRMKLMTKPGTQFQIKRKAFVMIKKAFDENGVKIATPTVQVSGDDKGPGPAANEVMRMRKNLEAQSLVAE
ncbi:mechanosensitive ion channel family protein [Aurantimonas sp. A2-1-M11]|uniref:mechanosensitive ion channel family protein n=1 Tax=Aurantimonas sp. A2-1-M11 TaxID=3113712 RepID=UPI002F91D098